MNTPEHYQAYSRKKVRFLLMITFILMGLGSISELYLLEHFEDTWQVAPILLIGVSLLFLLFIQGQVPHVFILLFKGLMFACMVSGLLGVWFHLKANMDFEAELHPTSSGGAYLWESLSGALPTLAPGSMIVFGLIGLLYSFLIIKQSK